MPVFIVAANNLGVWATIYINQNLKIPLPDEKILRRERVICRQQMKPEIVLSHFASEHFWEQQGITVGASRLEPDWIPFPSGATGLTGKPTKSAVRW